MKKPERLRTEFGPLEFDITYCDGPGCKNRGIIDYLVNWYKLGTQGIDAQTFSQYVPQDGADFCSITCLQSYLGMSDEPQDSHN